MYGFKILDEIWKVSFEISHKIWNLYTAKCALYEVLKLTNNDILESYDTVSLSEKGPWYPRIWSKYMVNISHSVIEC